MINILLFSLLLFEISPIFAQYNGFNTQYYPKPNLNSNSAKKKMAQFQKDLFNSNSFDDLEKLGVEIIHKPAEMNLFGRGSLRTGALTDNIRDATPGKCDPKPVCISNPLTMEVVDSNQFAFPPCINIHRCDGCCPTNEVCVAIKSHEVKLSKVGMINFDGERFKYDETVASVLNHTECQCQCQWNTNDDCRKVNPNFVKSIHQCECVCPETLYCDAFHQFDKETCGCVCRQDRFAKIQQTCIFRNFNWNAEKCKCEATKSEQDFTKRVMRIFN